MKFLSNYGFWASLGVGLIGSVEGGVYMTDSAPWYVQACLVAFCVVLAGIATRLSIDWN